MVVGWLLERLSKCPYLAPRTVRPRKYDRRVVHRCLQNGWIHVCWCRVRWRVVSRSNFCSPIRRLRWCHYGVFLPVADSFPVIAATLPRMVAALPQTAALDVICHVQATLLRPVVAPTVSVFGPTTPRASLQRRRPALQHLQVLLPLCLRHRPAQSILPLFFPSSIKAATLMTLPMAVRSTINSQTTTR